MAVVASHNPFRSRAIESLPYRFAKGDWAQLVSRLQQLKFRGAIVGPHGRGKTTLLRDLELRLNADGYQVFSVFLNDQQRSLPWGEFARLDRRILLSVDGVDLLHPLQWKLLKAYSHRFSGLLVTTHQEGMLPPLWHCESSFTLFQELVDELSDVKSLPVEKVYSLSNGNVRDAFFSLYDFLAQGEFVLG